MKTIKGIFALIMLTFFLSGILSSCAPATIERTVKSKQYSFAKRCSKGTCATYGANKRGTVKGNYGL